MTDLTNLLGGGSSTTTTAKSEAKALAFINLYTPERHKIGTVVVGEAHNNEFLARCEPHEIQQIFGNDTITAEMQLNTSQGKEDRRKAILASLGLNRML